jgi:DNA-binding CsgD family transcriptional regulator
MKITPRQYEIGRLAATNLPRAEIARRAGASVRTVDVTLWRLFQRLGVSSRHELASALLQCEVRETNGGGQRSRLGFERGDPVVVRGGRFEGFVGEYVGSANSKQIRVRIGGGTFALRAQYVERRAA